MSGKRYFLNPVSAQVLILEALPLRGERTVEELLPSDGCLVFDQFVKGRCVVFWLHRSIVEPGLDAVREDGYKHFSCTYFRTALLLGEYRMFPPYCVRTMGTSQDVVSIFFRCLAVGA
jgi:hypothetical protein